MLEVLGADDQGMAQFQQQKNPEIARIFAILNGAETKVDGMTVLFSDFSAAVRSRTPVQRTTKGGSAPSVADGSAAPASV